MVAENFIQWIGLYCALGKEVQFCANLAHILRIGEISTILRIYSQVQHGMGPLINMKKSVFLPLWDNYELYGHKILHIESFSAIESENLVRISKFFV